MPIGGRPILDYWINLLGDAGVSLARINTHTHPDQVRAHLAAHNARGTGLQIAESYEPQLLGSAGTVAANPDLAEGAEAVVLIDGDNFSDVDLAAMLDFHRGHGDPLTMLLFHAANPRACGIAELDFQGRIVDFVEKPAEPGSDLADAGVYHPDAARLIARSRRCGRLTWVSTSCPASSGECGAGSGTAITATSARLKR